MSIVASVCVERPLKSSRDIPVSTSTRVHLSPDAGGCGCIIPRIDEKDKDGSKTDFRLDRMWCGMKSDSVPGYYFICSECMGQNDQD